MRNKIVNSVMVSLAYLLFTISLVILEILAITGADAISSSLSETGNTMLSLAYALSILVLSVIPTVVFLYVIISIWCDSLVGLFFGIWKTISGAFVGGMNAAVEATKEKKDE